MGMSGFSDASDWSAAMAGDGEAFGRIFDRHQTRVYRHSLRLTGEVHDAEDVLAAAFLELWRRRSAVRIVDGSVLPWLLVTTNNLCLNRGRSLRRYRAFLAGLPHQEPGNVDAETAALSRADLDIDPRLLAEIRRMAPMDQQLLALVALEDLPLRQAAAALGVSEQAARSRWQRIRRRLADNATPDNATALGAALPQESQ